MKKGHLFCALLLFCGHLNVNAYIGTPDYKSTNFFRFTTGVTSGDGGWTVPLSNGHTLWMMSDSHLNDMKSNGTQNCLFQRHNQIISQPINNWNQSTVKLNSGSDGAGVFLPTDPKNYIWPGAGIEINGKVYVVGAEINTKGQLNLYTVDINSHAVSAPTKLPSYNDINFSIGFFHDPDGHVYTFGQKSHGGMWSNQLFVARFKQSTPFHNFEYWDGSTWNTDATKAKALVTGENESISVTKVKDKYVIFSTSFSVGCTKDSNSIYARVSDRPTGPWPAKQKVYQIDETKINGSYPFFYMAIGHPEFTDEPDKLLVTYCVNGYHGCIDVCKDVWKETWNPDFYRMRGFTMDIKALFALFKL